MNKIIPVFAVVLVVVVSFDYIIPNSYAYSQEKLTDKETLKAKIVIDPEDPQSREDTKPNIEFINPQTNRIQEHIDYTVKIGTNGNEIFGPITLTHTSFGSVSIPITLEEDDSRKNAITIDVEDILFQPIPKEIGRFDVLVGNQTNATAATVSPKEERKPASPYLAEWNSPFSLQLNQTAQIPLYDIQIIFSKILEDSRCPSDVQCVWEGDVRIQMDILEQEQKMKSVDFSLGANDITRMYLLDKFYLELIQIEPYPTSSLHEILPSDYSAVFVVKPQTDVKQKNDKEKEESSIPQQFKNHAAWWLEGQIDDDSFVQGIEALIKEKIVSVPSSYTVSDSENTTREIPQWVKNNVNWWLQGQTSDDVFLQGIEYLIENKIIVVV